MTRPKNSLITGIVLVASAASPASAGIVHVDADAPAGGDGTTWATAYRFLQDGLAAAVGGDEIRIGQGIYFADRDETNPAGTGDPAASFHVTNGTVVAGGYAGFGAPDPDARDIALFASVLEGDLLDDDTPYENRDDNTAHLLILDGVDASTRLDGLVVRAGNAGDDNGGGALVMAGAPVVRDCTFIDNWATRGGGLYAAGSMATIDRCTFRDNRGFPDGAPQVHDFGAGLCTDDGALGVRDCVFVGNRCASGGGFAEVGGASTLRRCVFDANSGGPGGGATASVSTTTFDGCRFAGNRAAACSDGFPCAGGGLLITGDVTVVNCVFVGNRGTPGAAISIGAGNPRIVNCTMFGNIPGQSQRGGIYRFAGAPSVENCIVWNDTVHGLPIPVRYSIVENGYPGGSVLSTDPGFTNGPSGTWTGVVYDESTGRSTVTDDNASYAPGAMVGRYVMVPGELGRPRGRAILANTETTVTVWGTASVNGDAYTVTDLRPGPGSPAIDAGFGSPVLEGADADHAGEPRQRDDPATADTSCGGTCPVDIGAYEFQAGAVACCPADLDGSGGVGFTDLVRILTAWGPCEGACPEDLDGSGAVDFGDVLALLGAWGPCGAPAVGRCCLDDDTCTELTETACAAAGGTYAVDCAACGDAPVCPGACGIRAAAPIHLPGDGSHVTYDLVIPHDGVWRLELRCGGFMWPDVEIGTACGDRDVLAWAPLCDDDDPPPFIEVALDAGTYGLRILSAGDLYTLQITPE